MENYLREKVELEKWRNKQRQKEKLKRRQLGSFQEKPVLLGGSQSSEAPPTQKKTRKHRRSHHRKHHRPPPTPSQVSCVASTVSAQLLCLNNLPVFLFKQSNSLSCIPFSTSFSFLSLPFFQ